MKFTGHVYVFRCDFRKRKGRFRRKSWTSGRNVKNDEMEIGSSLEISGEYLANRKSKGNILKFEKKYIYIYAPNEK